MGQPPTLTGKTTSLLQKHHRLHCKCGRSAGQHLVTTNVQCINFITFKTSSLLCWTIALNFGVCFSVSFMISITLSATCIGVTECDLRTTEKSLRRAEFLLRATVSNQSFYYLFLGISLYMRAERHPKTLFLNSSNEVGVGGGGWA